MPFVWIDAPEKVFVPMATRYVADLENGVLAIVERRAPEAEAWMKANHPWQNRTGAAEAGLHTVVEHMARSMITLILSHGDDVPYGIWLEVKATGIWGIIPEAVDYWGAIIWSDIQAMLA